MKPVFLNFYRILTTNSTHDNNYTYYGRYKNTREAAWSIILEHGITTLPIPVTGLAVAMGVFVISYEKADSIIDFWGFRRWQNSSDAFTAKIDGKWFVFFDDTIPDSAIRFAIAHELAHYLLGHEKKTEIHPQETKLALAANSAVVFLRSNTPRKDWLESEADTFARRLLAPACVLWALDIHHPQDIADLCGIPLREAVHRAKRMKILHERKKFLSSDTEQKVYAQFLPFIHKQKGSI